MPYRASIRGPFLSTTGRIPMGLPLSASAMAHYNGFVVHIDTESVHSYAY